MGPSNQILLTFKLYEPIYYYVVSSYMKKKLLKYIYPPYLNKIK